MAKTFAKVLSSTLAATILVSVVPMTTASAATTRTITLLNKDGLTDTTARVGDSFELTANDSSLTDTQQKNGKYDWSMTRSGFLEMGQAADKSYLNKKKFTAKKIGLIEVTAKRQNGEEQGSNFVTVNMGMHPQSGRKNWNTGDTFRLYTLGDYDGTYTWSSNNTDVLTVSAPTKMTITTENHGLVEGKGQVGDHISYVDVTAKAAGSATILVNAKKDGAETQYAAEIFHVKDAASSVTITDKNGSAVKEIDLDYERIQSTNTDKTYYDALTASSNNGDWVLWSTSDENICSITGFDSGMVWITPHKAGTVTLKASTYKGKFAECVVNVKQAATEVKLYLQSDNSVITDGTTTKGLKMTQNEKVNIIAKMTPSTSTDYIESWTSSSPSIVTVAAESKGSNKATVTAKGAGTATITAITNRGVTRVFSVNVSGGIPATGITLDKTSVTLDTRTAASIVITPTMTPAGTTDSIVWTSSNENIVKFSSKTNLSATIVPGTQPGTATITATTSSGKKATCVVTVVVPATSIKLSETSRAMFTGESATLTTTLTPANSNDNITYSTNNSSVLSLTPSADGKTVTVKALAAGTAKVTATSEKGKATSECNFTVTKKETATSITFDYSTVSVEKGKSSKLEYKINPTAAQDYTNVTWSSSNTSVATVDANGVVRGVAKGTATITATTDNSKSAKCTVKVTVPATSVKLDATSKTIKAREGFILKATMTPADTTDTIAWSTSNANVATVDTSGNVYGVAAGTATITATTTSGKKATCSVRVEASVANFIVDYDGGSINSRLNVGGKSKTAVLTAKSGQTLSGTYTWKVVSGNSVTVTPSADTLSATINPTSNVGISEVQVTDSKGDTASIFYSVKKPANSIKFTQSTYDVDLNQFAVLPVTMDNGTGDDWIVWGSSDNNVVAIDAGTGLLQAKKVAGGGNSGVATVTATLPNGNSASCTVFVRQPATGVKTKDMDQFEPLSETQNVDVASLTMVRGRTKDLEIVFNPGNSTDYVASWEVKDPSICDVKSTSSKNDKITISALKAGITSVVAETNRGQQFTITVAVQQNYPAASLELGTEYVNLDLTDSLNNTYNLSATMRLSSDDPDIQTTDKIIWTSDNVGVASIVKGTETNSGCKIEAKGAGVAHITATTTSGLVKTCTVKVVVPVTGITFTAGNIRGATSKTVASGKDFQLTATVTPSNSKDQLTWTVEDESIATISNATDRGCKVIGVNGGDTHITCTAESGYSIDFTVKVLKSANEVTISAPKTTLYVGDKSKLTAKLNPSDAQESVEWMSSNSNAVKIDEGGNITAVAVGQATITAQCKIDGTNTVKNTVIIKVVKPAESIKFSRTVAEIQKNGQATFSVTLSAGSQDSVTWTSSNTKVATVTSGANNQYSATVKGIASGTAKITAKTGSGRTVTATVKIIENATSMTLNKNSVTVDKNSKITLVAKMNPSTASESITWSTSNQSIATVSSTGVVTTKNVSGQVIITARTKSGKTATCTVIVKPSKVTGFKVKSTDSKSVTLSWTKSSEANGYYIYRKVNGKYKLIATINNPSTTTYKNSGLKAATTYTFAIVGFKKLGSTTVRASYPSINATTRLSAVPGFKVSSQSTSAIKLSWSKVSGATGYEVYRQSGSKWVKIATGKSTTYTNKKLKAGTAYTYRIRAYKTVGKTKVYSASWSTVKTATKTATPTLTVKGASKSVKISWKKVSGASGYEVFMSTSKNGKYKKIATLSSSKSSYTKTKLKKGSSCYIRVRAYKTVSGKKIYSGYQTKGAKVK